MNDPTVPFVTPRPEVSWMRRQARALRRFYVRTRRDRTVGEARKQWNVELNWREFWHGQTHLDSRPRLIQVGTNWTCNLKCNFCRLTMEWTQAEMRKLSPSQRELSPRVVETVKALLPYAEMMVLTPLGEPFLWSGLDDLLAFHAAAGSRNLALTTNGMLLSDRNCERVVRGQLNHLYCSVDSNDPAVYAGMRVGGELARIEDNLRRLVAWKRKLNTPFPTMTLNATFMRRNIGQLPSMVAWAKELGFEEISVQLMEIENPELEDEFLGYFPHLVHDHVLEALALGRRLGIVVRPHLAIRNLISAAREGRDVSRHDYTAAAPNMPNEQKQLHLPAGNGSYGNLDDLDPAAASCAGCAVGELEQEAQRLEPMLDMQGKTLVEKCHYPWYNLLIDTDGDVRPCCWADTSWGNLNALEFEAIWNGRKAIGMRKAFLANKVPHSCQKKHCRVDL